MVTRVQQTDEADALAGAQRASMLRGLLWTRALPGGVAVIAALTIPEFSVGAGEFADGKRSPEPVKPPSTAGQGQFKPGASAANQPLAGVRYAALLEIGGTTALPSAKLRLAKLGPAPFNPDGVTFAPSNRVKVPAALASVATPSAAGTSLPVAKRAPLAQASFAKGPSAPAAPVSANALDAAATFAASVLDGYVAPPGLGAEVSLAARAPALADPASADALDAAATYTAFVLESFAVPTGVDALPTTGEEWGSMPMLENSGEDDRAVELVPTLVEADPAGEAGLVPPIIMPMPAAGLAMSEPAVSEPAVSEPAVSEPTVSEPAVSLPVAPAPAAPNPAPQAAALAPLPKPPVAAPSARPSPAPGLGTSTPLKFGIKSQLVTRVDGKTAGAVEFQQTAAGLSVRLGSIVEVLSDRYDPAEIARIRTSEASNVYLSLADLQAQGIPISYDPVYDEFNVGQIDTRPSAAR
jgi:hypothetical protein